MKAKQLFMIIGLFTSIQVMAHVGLVYPESGEIFNAGETVNIQWEIVVPHNTQNWDLYFSPDGGSNWDPIKLDIDVDSLSYKWTVPDVATSQGRIRIVMDNGGGNYSDDSGDFTIVTVTGIEETTQHFDFNVYPNPMVKSTTISYANQGNESLSFVLYNANGKVVRFFENITTGKLLIYREELPAGVYYFRFLNESKIKANGKIIIAF
jgi:hypothetical protein